MSEIEIPAGASEVQGVQKDYWNSKTGGYAKVGDRIKGVYIRIETGEYKNKPTENYVIKSSADGHEIVLPNHAVLNGMMLNVKVGRTVIIEYLGKGEGKRGRNAPELYKVWVTPDPTVEVPKPAPVEKKVAMADYMQEIITELIFGEKFFAEGLIPFASVQETIRAACRKYNMRDPTTPDAIFQGMVKAGEMYEPKLGFFKVSR